MQHVPGTPLALAQTRRLKAGLAKGPVSFSDISVTEKEAAWARDYFNRA